MTVAEQQTGGRLLLLGLAGLALFFKEGQNWILGAAICTMIFLLLLFGFLSLF